MVLKSNIISSRLPDVGTVVGKTVPELLREISLNHNWGDAVAFECLESKIKYSQADVFRMSRAFAAGLINLGLKRGDVVCMVLPNSPQFASILYGIWEAGGICSPINPALTLDEMTRMLEHSESKFVISGPELAPGFELLKTTVSSLKNLQILLLTSPKTSTGVENSFFEMIKTDTTAGQNFLSGSEIDTTKEVALLAYSSGTTGLPKAVMLTHANLCTCILQHIQPGVILMDKFSVEKTEAERQIGLLPCYHIMGMIYFCFVGMATGAHTVTITKYNPAIFMKTVRAHKPTILHMVTPLVAMMANDPLVTRDDFKSIKTIICGAAPIGPALISRFLKKANKTISFQECYGMTEMTLFSMLNPSIFQNKTGSIGTIVASTKAKVVPIDGSGVALGVNQIGELCVKGPQVMKGYLKDPAATWTAIDVDGWLHTGDLCYYDADECFYIVDRLKELIKVKGMQVAPAELENTLREHPLILEAAVIGVRHEEFGEIPKAYIVRKSNLLTEEKVHDHMKAKLAHFKQLKGGICFVETIPKAPSGKILRRQLRDSNNNNNQENTLEITPPNIIISAQT